MIFRICLFLWKRVFFLFQNDRKIFEMLSIYFLFFFISFWIFSIIFLYHNFISLVFESSSSTILIIFRTSSTKNKTNRAKNRKNFQSKRFFFRFLLKNEKSNAFEKWKHNEKRMFIRLNFQKKKNDFEKNLTNRKANWMKF